MKRICLFILFYILTVSGASSQTSGGRITRVISGYVLIDTQTVVGSIGDRLNIQRRTEHGLIGVGTVQILEFRDGKTAARVVEEYENYAISVGDIIEVPNMDRFKKPDMLEIPGIKMQGSSSEKGGRASNQAVFGLKWGMSSAQIENAGVKLECVKKENNIAVYSTVSLPIDLPSAELYKLLFDEKRGFVKVGMITRNITDDPYGIKGKNFFDTITSAMSRRYVENPDYCIMDVRTEKPEDFYPCLTSSECGTWHRLFTGPNKIILLMLHGVKKGEGYIELLIEAVPQFSETMEEYEALMSGG